MKISFARQIACVLLFLAATGCGMHQTSPRPTIPLVERIIGDTQSPEYQFLSRYDASDPRGDIVLLDTPERCFRLSERLVRCDVRDNGDGAALSDLLPDFAGERITTLIDLQYTPYSRFVLADNGDALREVTVRAALAAVDTACCLGPFDHEKRSSKPSAKLLVISSPYMAAYGGFDVDTLFRATGANVPVISAPATMMTHVMDARGKSVNLGILSDSLTARSGAYQVVFDEVRRQRGDAISTLTTFVLPGEAVPDSLAQPVADRSEDLFMRILDQYSKSGRSLALDALVVDGYTVTADTLRTLYREILNQPSDENAFYRKMLSKDFEIIDGPRVVTDACYRYLRDHNLFTHNIAYPLAAAFITSPEAKGYMLMDFDVNALPLEMINELRADAPETFKMYVQDQYHARRN